MNPNVSKILNGDIVALAKAITLCESKIESQMSEAREILKLVEGKKTARRITISGPPGVGKSTFIEALGLKLIESGRRVAVLAIDPTSSITGGSILGDRTRMEELSKNHDAFIRPSPSGDHLGGVAAKTREAILLCEAAGFDDVIIETVGVGQSEFEASQISDVMILLAQAGSGDDLQGIKRGIMEVSDIIVVNKADGKTLSLAEQTQNSLIQATHLSLGHKNIPVLLASALKREGITEVMTELDRYFLDNKEQISLKRLHQRRFWMKELYIARVRAFWQASDHEKKWKEVDEAVTKGEISVWEGSEELFHYLVS